MASPGTIRFVEINATPAAPPSGSAIIYIKTDNVIYLQDSNGIEVPLGTASGITSLTGEATGTGPGAAVITLSNSAVIGKVLTGFVSGPNSTVLSTDTLLQAIQKLQAQVSAGVGSAITSLTGDVTGTGPGAAATTVVNVGGKSASDISDSVDDTQAATASNTSSTIVKRDASGNFSANIITANLSGNAATSTSFTGPLVGDVTGTQGATVVSFVGGQNASDISDSVEATQDATSINTASTLVERDASGNFAANEITADLIGDVTGSASNNVLKSGDTMTGPLLNSNTTQSTTKDTGSVILDGGLGVEKNINAGGTILGSNISGSTSGTNTGDVTVTDSDTVNLSLVGQDIQADVRISDATITSDINGIKVGTVPAVQVSGLATVATTGAYSDLSGTPSSLPPSGSAGGDLSGSYPNPTISTTKENFLLDRANHTGTQLASTISDFNEAAQDTVGGILTDTATIDFTYDDTLNTISAIVVDSSITDTKIASGIDAAKIADGSVSNTEFQFINSVTSNVQTQLNDRELLSNKATDLSILNNTLYPTTQAVQSAINSSILSTPIFVLTGLNSSISGYKQLVRLSEFVPGVLSTVSQTATTSETLMQEFATNLGQPNITALPIGSITFHYETQKSSGSQTYYSYCKLFKRDSGGTETLLITSDNSDQINTNTVEQVSVNALNATIIPLLVTDLLVVKIYTRMVSGSHLITLRWDSNTDARLQLPGSAINYIPENVANKSTDGTLSANSNILYPSQSAVKTYADTKSSLLHASQHLPSGSDPLTTAAPLADLSATTTNDAGTAESFSKSDHSHAISTGVVSTQIPDQANAAGSSANLAKADHVHNIPSGSVVQIGTSNFPGASSSFALADHVHSHGNQTSGTLHAAATISVNGFMSVADKIKLDAATALATASTLVFRDASGNFLANEITSDLVGDVTGNVSGSALSFTGNLAGDVSGTQGATVVDFVGGRTSDAIDTAVGNVEDATNLASPGTIARRDASGDFALRDLTVRKTLPSVVSLVDGASIATDAALGNVFTVTIAGNRTFSAPTNPTADQKITYKIRQDAVGGRVITWDAAFNFGVDLSGVPNSTSPDVFDYYGFQYDSITSTWHCLAISRGY